MRRGSFGMVQDGFPTSAYYPVKGDPLWKITIYFSGFKCCCRWWRPFGWLGFRGAVMSEPEKSRHYPR